ncbi:MAG: hypothetical protein ACQZ3M_06490 [cyanobacterium endosymbiont of Rhopalodia fuxianensis]
MIVSTEYVCITLDQRKFLTLLEGYSVFTQFLKEQCILPELFGPLSIKLEQKAQSSRNFKELTIRVLSDTQVYYLSAGNLASEALILLQNPKMLWSVSGGEKIINYPVDSCISQNRSRFAQHYRLGLKDFLC